MASKNWCENDPELMAAFNAGFAAAQKRRSTKQTQVCVRAEAPAGDDAKAFVAAVIEGAFPSLQCCNTGSWPKPKWLYNGAPSHTQRGDEYVIGWTTKDEAKLTKLQEKATHWAVQEQLATGIDIITDGEQRRENYIFYHARKLNGIDFDRTTLDTLRAGSQTKYLPTIVGPITVKEEALGFLADDWREAVAAGAPADRLKMSLPGPMTLFDTVCNRFYQDHRTGCEEIAAALRKEVALLVAAGCRHITIDEPVFVRYPKETSEWGVKTLDSVFVGLDGIEQVTVYTHICCSYPTCPKKAPTENYGNIAAALQTSAVDFFSIEHAHKPLDLSVLMPKFGKQRVQLGVVDNGRPRVESVEEIKATIREALQYVPAEQLMVSQDCGMVLLDPEIAKQKTANMAEAVRQLRVGA